MATRVIGADVNRQCYNRLVPEYRILKYRDPYKLPDEEFPTGPHVEGLVIEFYPASGEKWVGNFHEGGVGGTTEVIEHPNGKCIIVVAAGDAYIVDPETRSLVSELGGGPIMNIVQVPDLELVLLVDPFRLTAIGPEGVRWRTRDVAVDGIRSTQVTGTTLSGEANAIDDSWQSFTVDLKDGRVGGGAYRRPDDGTDCPSE